MIFDAARRSWASNKRPFCASLFLAVGYHLGLLSRRECGIVADEHRRYRDRGLGQWRCGDVAKQLGLLNHSAVTRILDKQSELRDSGLLFEDPLGGFATRLQAKRHLSVPVKAGLGIGGLLLLPLIVFLAGGNLAKVADALAIAGFLGSILLILMPAVFRLPFTVTGWLRWTSIPLGVSVALFLWVRARALMNHPITQPPTQTPDAIISFVSQMRAGITVLVGLLVLSSLAGAWRHWQIRVHEIRTGLLRQIVFKVYDYLARMNDADGNVDVHAMAAKTMERACRLISLNPYHALGDRITRLRKRGPFGATSLWYLEPDGSQAERFRIRLFAAPGAPEAIQEIFRKIQATHFPLAFDREQWAHFRKLAAANRTQKGGSIRDHLLHMEDRHKYISLTGYVFATERTLMSDRSDRCPAFDRGYAAHIPSSLGKRDLAWLDFQSFLALPVRRIGKGGSGPLGVVIAFKNVQNGLTRDDWNVMSSLARLLGLLFAQYPLEEKVRASELQVSAGGSLGASQWAGDS